MFKKILFVTLITLSSFAGDKVGKSMKAEKIVTLGKSVSLLPKEFATGPEGLKITNLGYGHKFGGGPGKDFSFVEVEVAQNAEQTTLRVHTPLKGKPVEEWNGWEFTFVRCDDAGPPHSNDSAVVIQVTKK